MTIFLRCEFISFLGLIMMGCVCVWVGAMDDGMDYGILTDCCLLGDEWLLGVTWGVAGCCGVERIGLNERKRIVVGWGKISKLLCT